MNELTEGLNPEQARAVETLEGPLLILAGAGSGKTRVLTRRIANLLHRGTIGENGPALRPWNILAVTFTNKAAGEMRERVTQLVGEWGKHVWVSTFHSTCVRILRQDIEPLGFTRDFVIYDDDDQIRVIKGVLDEMKISHKELTPSAVRARIDAHKNGIRKVAPVALRADPLPKMLELYSARLKRANALDFNDLVNKVADLWELRPDILSKWQDRWRYVMVDEYQDTNPGQYRLIKLLASREPNLAVVGDDDQSIYSFRGADIRNILDFENDFPGAAVIRLEENYRSTGNILRAASSVVKHNHNRKEKTLRTAAEEGELIRLVLAPDEVEEAAGVVNEIRRLRKDRPWSDFAIIYRTNAQSRPFEQELTRQRIPHVLVGGRKFYDRAEVRDMVGYLRLILNPGDDVSFQRVVNTPTRGLGDKAIGMVRDEADKFGISLRAAARQLGGIGGRAGNALGAFSLLMDRLEQAAQLMPAGDLVKYIAEQTGYIDMLKAEGPEESAGRLENIEELARAAADPDEALPEDAGPIERLRAFLDRASLAGQADELPDEGAGAVTLLTAHLAKGLEFPIVFLVGMVEKCFPHARSEREEEIEEERRLAYVAITRAKQKLTISLPLRRRAPEGYWDDTIMSRFVREIPDAVLDRPASSLLRPGFGRATPGVPARAPFSPMSPARAPMGPARPGVLNTRAPTPMRAARPADQRTLAPDSLEVFQEGTAVFHPMLGAGTVRKREGIPANPKLTIHFKDHGHRTVYAVSAGLELLLE